MCVFVCDISDNDESAVSKLGPLRGVIQCAGIANPKRVSYPAAHALILPTRCCHQFSVAVQVNGSFREIVIISLRLEL